MPWTKAKLQELQNRLRVAYPDAKCALDHQNPFELVVATILSAQCTDARVNLTTPAFFRRFPSPAKLAKAALTDVETLIRSTGFFHNKAKNLIGMASALMDRHGGEVPNDAELLARLPGVGQKTANVVLANAFDVPALAVDTHIFRVSRRLGLSEAKTPEKVEDDLTRQFPREDWIELHHQLIFLGRRTCDARKPDCAHCELHDLCPTGKGKIADPHSGIWIETTGPGLPAVKAMKQKPEARGLKPDTPQRIISLVPSVTELLVRWGLAARIVGRTRYCIEPKWIRNTVPEVGGTKDPNLDRIRDLKPDLVILETDENEKATASALTKAKIPWLALEIRSVSDAMKTILQLGESLGVSDQAKLDAKKIKALLRAKTRKGPRTLTLIWKDPWMSAGPDTYPSDLARQAGFTPIGPDRYPRLDEEALDALAPDVILLPTEPYRFTARHAAALRKRFPKARVHLVDGQAMTWYLSRSEEGLKMLRDLTRTD
jgi:endonuclease III